MAEYDALPEVGHACGHNLIAASSVGAALGLAAIAGPAGMSVKIYGTPAEEGGGGKIIKAEVPLSEMFGYSTSLRSATQGRATYSMEFKHYSEAPKNVIDAIVTSKAK